MNQKKRLNFAVFNYIYNGIFIIDREQKIVFWNKVMSEWTGLGDEHVLGKKLIDIFPAFATFIYQYQIESVLKYGTTAIFSSHLHRDLYLLRGAAKVAKYLHTTVNFLPLEDSQEPYAIFSVEDQTQLTELIFESKKSQDKLLVKEEQLQKANQELELRVSERTKDLQRINSALKKEIEERSKYARQVREGKEKLAKQNQKLLELNVKLRETNSQLNQTNEQLKESKLKAEESDRLKSAFLANMSHEIRTPMNSIIGFSELLQEELLPQDLRKVYLEMVLKSGHQLLALINDILDISKIESGQIVINKSPEPIHKLLEEIKQTFTLEFEKKSLELIIVDKLPEGYKATIDYVRTIQILNNFISNALKFTDNGYVEILAKLKGRRLYFHVRDTGIGIREEFHQKIFMRFQQGNKDMYRVYGGTGLGLAISKNLAEMMGGEIFMESKYRIGSKFGIILPTK